MDMDVGLVLTALTGSGGIVALITILLQHRQKMAELKAQHRKVELHLEQVKNKVIPLEYHPLFSALDEIEHFFMWSFDTADAGRTIVIRELCVNKLRIWRDIIMRNVAESQICYSECNSVDRETCNKTENQFRKMLLEGLEAYTKLWDQKYMYDVYGKIQYDAASYQTMQKFLPIFQKWHLSREEMVRVAAHDIPNCNMNSSCYEDWWDMLTIYLYAFTQMKYDAVNAMRSLNGQITGDYILGVEIGPCSLRREKDVRSSRFNSSFAPTPPRY